MKRILIKLSGESLSNKKDGLAIDSRITNDYSRQIKQLVQLGYKVGIVVGGGNFWRGGSAEKKGISRNRADYIGMLATIMNGLALQSALEAIDTKVKIQSSLNVDNKVAENYVNEKAIKALENNEVIIFAGGIGRPFFTTDTAATLLASEMGIKTILMGKNHVDGVYDKDPKIYSDAKKFDFVSYDQVINKNLKVMDITAITMADENNIEIIVFDITEKDALIRVLKEEISYTIVKKG
ncbi:MAG: UMP kinase [Mycoplasma sp.]|nr:UMP kinase [Mycoplasma sp.]